MAKLPARILMRVTVDCTYADLLQDLLGHTGRRRARRIVFLAALGKLAERGALQSGLAPNSSQHTVLAKTSRNGGDALSPIAFNPEDVEFLARLQDGLP